MSSANSLTLTPALSFTLFFLGLVTSVGAGMVDMLGPIFTTLNRNRPQISPSGGIILEFYFFFFARPWRLLGLFQLVAGSRFAFQRFHGHALFLSTGAKRIEAGDVATDGRLPGSGR